MLRMKGKILINNNEPMKHFVIFFVTLLLASCNLFQKTQPAGESVAVEEKQQEVFVPVDKELYVISHTALQYTEPDLLSNPDKQESSFGNLFEIEAELFKQVFCNSVDGHVLSLFVCYPLVKHLV